MLSVILLIVSVVAFILSQTARMKADAILVTQALTVPKEKIKALGLYVGLALHLHPAEEINIIQVWVKDAAGMDVLLGVYTGPVEYDLLKKKKVHAFVHSVYGDTVVVEIKLNDALK